jgi:hypothetical protein
MSEAITLEDLKEELNTPEHAERLYFLEWELSAIWDLLLGREAARGELSFIA